MWSANLQKMARIRLFEKICPYLKKLQLFSINSFKTVFLVLWNIELFRLFWFRANVMSYVECEFSKVLVRIRLFEKKLSLFKEVAVFPTISFNFFLVLRNSAIFRNSWFRTSCMGYVNCESANKMARILLFEKKLSLIKEVAVFPYNHFQYGFFGFLKYLIFPVFLI